MRWVRITEKPTTTTKTTPALESTSSKGILTAADYDEYDYVDEYDTSSPGSSADQTADSASEYVDITAGDDLHVDSASPGSVLPFSPSFSGSERDNDDGTKSKRGRAWPNRRRHPGNGSNEASSRGKANKGEGQQQHGDDISAGFGETGKHISERVSSESSEELPQRRKPTETSSKNVRGNDGTEDDNSGDETIDPEDGDDIHSGSESGLSSSDSHNSSSHDLSGETSGGDGGRGDYGLAVIIL
jgi:hypothetical protein